MPRPPADAPTIRWIGHATVQIELGGVRILTDPALTTRLAHLRRRSPLDASTIEPPDVVLISHVHQDHLHLPSLRRFGPDVPLVVPAGAGAFLHRRGFADVTESRAGDAITRGALTIETVPAVHPRGRGPHSSLAADPVGYIVRSAGQAVYFAGDTDLFDGMGSWAPVDVALLPIWGWGPTLGEGHLDPTTAARAAELIRPGVVVPVHWGTFTPFGLRRPEWLETPARRFREELAAAGLEDGLRVLAPGGSFTAAPRTPHPPAPHPRTPSPPAELAVAPSEGDHRP